MTGAEGLAVSAVMKKEGAKGGARHENLRCYIARGGQVDADAAVDTTSMVRLR